MEKLPLLTADQPIYLREKRRSACVKLVWLALGFLAFKFLVLGSGCSHGRDVYQSYYANLSGKVDDMDPIQYKSDPIDLVFKDNFGLKCTGVTPCIANVTVGNEPSFYYQFRSKNPIEYEINVEYDPQQNLIDVSSGEQGSGAVVELIVTVPPSMFHFAVHADIAVVDWPLSKLASYGSNVGAGLTILRGLKTKTFESIVKAGVVTGDLSGFKTLDVKVDVGSVDLNLSPSKHSQSNVNLKLGDAKLNFTDFAGAFEASVKIGSIDVKGAEIEETRTTMVGKALTGKVGEGDSFLDVNIVAGAIALKFE